MKKRKYIFILMIMISVSLFAKTGKDIVREATDQNEADSTHSLINLKLVEKNGSTGERIIEMFGKKNSKDESMALIIFHSPASVKNTRFLSLENEGRSSDQWIYLPALKRVRRISASEGGKSFMGTDLTYDDMGTRDIDADTHTLKGEEKIDGRICYIVESIPKDPEDSQYSRRVSWIDKDRMIPLKTELYDKDGKLLKILTTGNIKNIQGHWTPMKTTMKNVQTGHYTVIEVKKMVYNEKLPDGIFTSRFLQTGRL